ncbi:hypothetical protein [Spirosoma montaniterrae]|uniref:Uncharacterized protein n=1 Tax=Spirosoma montaniterrae TaxID=1178516 RepID=A0A1P9X374_9BACT|nr:hypothetical protein [Spirosoma montaniterrae]AQG82090.1 hypothetical protein AWR27_24005 [Spirosoma montaniterrae]
MRNGKVWLILVALLLVSASDLLAQCAMCRGTVESTVSNGRSIIASELNFGILYLLIVPYLIVATIGYLWYRNSKREHERRLEITGRVRRALSQM